MSHNIGTDAEIYKIRMEAVGDTSSTPASGFVNLVVINNRLMLKDEGGSLRIATSYQGKVLNSETTTIGTSQSLDFSGVGEIQDDTNEFSWSSGTVHLPNGKYFVDFWAFLDNSASPTGTFRTLKLLDNTGTTISVDYQPVSSLRYQMLHVSGIVANGFSIGITHDASSDIAFGHPSSTITDNPYGFFFKVF